MKIKMQFEVKVYNDHKMQDWHYEVKEIVHECDPNKSSRDNLHDAFEEAERNGHDYRRTTRWSYINE
jgi:hypothetical protein